MTPMTQQKHNVDVFDRDAQTGGGYVYTDQDRFSSRIANARMSKALHETYDWRGKSVLDLGCGDGTYTVAFEGLGASKVLGIDPAAAAVTRGTEKARTMNLSRTTFQAGNLYALSQEIKGFDVVVLRGVLHHLPDAKQAIAIALQIGRSVVILEPNGFNPVLKLLEKFSTYHREHEEQSFAPVTLDAWCKNAGGHITARRFINLVPMFCPTGLTKLLDAATPLVERIPLLRAIACGQYIVRADRT